MRSCDLVFRELGLDGRELHDRFSHSLRLLWVRV